MNDNNDLNATGDTTTPVGGMANTAVPDDSVTGGSADTDASETSTAMDPIMSTPVVEDTPVAPSEPDMASQPVGTDVGVTGGFSAPDVSVQAEDTVDTMKPNAQPGQVMPSSVADSEDNTGAGGTMPPTTTGM